MSTGNLLLLGAIAGFTIFLGLPVGRMRALSTRTCAFLNATATGILVFLLYDVLGHGTEPVKAALNRATDHGGSWVRFAGLSLVFLVGTGVGLLGLVYYDRWMARRGQRFGPGTAAVEEFTARSSARSRARSVHALSEPKRLALFIAIGIGLHNFSEGLAIGQSAAGGELSLALLLIIGFGLHNATEGFGIVAPLSAESVVPSWAFLGILGLIGGGPTFLGTVVGQAWVNDAVLVAFLALAAGSILYVVVQLLGVAQKLGHKELLMWGLLAGLLAGFATDFVLAAARV